MNLADYIQQQGHGAKSRLARAINSNPVDVGNWVRGLTPVPPRRVMAIERATGGAVTRKDLRPNDWADFWPEPDADTPTTTPPATEH